MTALSDRVAALEGASREMDGEVATALGWKRRVPNGLRFEYWFSPTGDRVNPPAFTASIDAARTVAPDLCLTTISDLWDGDKVSGFAIVHQYRRDDDDGKLWRFRDFSAIAATPALALLSAALKASGL